MRQIHKAKEQEKCPFYVLALFDRTLAHLATENNWARSFIGEVEPHGSTNSQ
jgi:hypothetical protein